jgi:hypothetical protein
MDGVVRRLAGDLSVTYVIPTDTHRVLGRDVSHLVTDSEVNKRVVVSEANTLDNEFNSTGELTEGREDGSDSVRRSDDLADIEGVEIVEPSTVPSTEDDELGVVSIVSEGRVLSARRSLLALGLNSSPGLGIHIHHTASVDGASESTGSSFGEVGTLTTHDEVLPGGDSLDHNGGMVPSGDIVVNIGIIPFTAAEIESEDVVVVGFRVPSTV